MTVGDVSFEVTYDGLTQTVSPATGDRDAGAAAPLYDEPTIGVEAPCTSEGFATPQVQPDVSCVVNARAAHAVPPGSRVGRGRPHVRARHRVLPRRQRRRAGTSSDVG
jgi:hypothetical protein